MAASIDFYDPVGEAVADGFGVGDGPSLRGDERRLDDLQRPFTRG